MTDKTHSCQDIFLNFLTKDEVSVHIYLINGVRLQGRIVKFDKFSILLLKDDHLQLVYKGAVATIMPFLPTVSFEQHIDNLYLIYNQEGVD